MKVTIKSVIRSSQAQFECFQDQQIVFKVGNTLCIKQIGKPQSEFISLNKNIDKLLAFKPMTNRKGIFTVERVGKQIQASMYKLDNQRKVILLPFDHQFAAQITKIQLMVDDYDNYLLYGSATTKESNCIFMADFGKGKILSIGYLSPFDDWKVDTRENMTLSVCGNNGSYNYIKCLQYSGGKWEITQEILKKIPGHIIQHQILIGGRKLMVTKNCMYLLQDYELSRTLEIEEQGTEIVQIIKIPKGFVVRLANNNLQLWVDDSQQFSFIKIGRLRLSMQKNHTIQGIKLSNNTQQLWLRTSKNDLFVWKCDQIDTDIDSGQLSFNKIDFPCSIQKEGVISLSAQKKLALLAGCNSVVLWSIEKSQVIISTQFTDAIDPTKRAVLSGAINPDGSSLILAFDDKVKLYNILFTKFKFYAQFPLKRVQQITYSHGGQLVACRYGRNQNSCIVIINLLRLVQICSFKIGAQPLQIFFNQLDDQLYSVNDNKTIQIYKLSEQTRSHTIKLDSTIKHARLDYKDKRLIISTQNKICIVEGGQIVQEINHPFLDFQYLYPLYGMYFVVGKNGMLYWSKDIKFQDCHQCMLFDRSFQLLCRSGNLIAYSSFQNALVLKLSKGGKGKQKLGEDVVMIQKDQILSLFEKVKIVQSKYQMLVSSTAIKLEDQRQNYKSAISELQQRYQQEVKFSHTNYQQITEGKLKQQKQTEVVFETLERGQTKGLNEIEHMYQRKCKIERQKVMNLQQQALSQKIKYQQLILQLQKKYHKDIEVIRNEYSKKLKNENTKIEDIKQNHLKDKKRIQLQLVQLQQQTEVTMRDLQISKDTIIQKLRLDQKLLMQQNEQCQIQLDAKEQNLNKLKYVAQRKDGQLSKLFTKLNQAQNRVKMLEKELKDKKEMLEQRDQIIKQQTHQIDDLFKAKHVLSFRTTQIRKQLEPKQTMIDKLKSQLMKLDEEYKQMKKKNFIQDQKQQKLQTITNILKKENSDLKIQLKYKERIHDELCSQIFMVVNTIDPKDWNSEFIKIYQNYIKEDNHKNRQKKKKDDTSQEINRHLIHVEQSLIQVTSGTDRIMKGKDKEVFRKMNQNSKLIYELNVMRKKQNQYQQEKKQLLNQNARLNRQISQSAKTTTRTQTAKTGLTKRFVISRQLNSRGKNATLDVSDLSASKNDTRDIRKQRSRLASARRTLMMQQQIKHKSGKFFDIAKQLQSTKRQLQTSKKTIILQQSQIEELNQRIFISGEPIV